MPAGPSFLGGSLYGLFQHSWAKSWKLRVSEKKERFSTTFIDLSQSSLVPSAHYITARHPNERERGGGGESVWLLDKRAPIFIGIERTQDNDDSVAGKRRRKKNDLAATIRELRPIDGYPSDCASTITARHNEYQLTRQHDCTLFFSVTHTKVVRIWADGYYVKRRPWTERGENGIFSWQIIRKGNQQDSEKLNHSFSSKLWSTSFVLFFFSSIKWNVASTIMEIYEGRMQMTFLSLSPIFEKIDKINRIAFLCAAVSTHTHTHTGY